MFSRLLNDQVVIAEDEEPVFSGGRVVYRRREILRMQGLPAVDIRAIHDLKKDFGGELVTGDETHVAGAEETPLQKEQSALAL